MNKRTPDKPAPGTVSAYQRAQEAIKQLIVQENLRPGDSLPPESFLAAQLGMSRSSLREGIKALESVGVLETRHGSGIYIRDFNFDRIFENMPYAFAAFGKTFRDVLQVRMALEVGLCDALARTMTPQLVDELESLIAGMNRRLEAGQEFSEEDRAFHQTLYRNLDNPFLDRVVALFWELFHAQKTTFRADLWQMQQTITEHQAIVDALRERSSEAARAAMQQHFTHINSKVHEL